MSSKKLISLFEIKMQINAEVYAKVCEKDSSYKEDEILKAIFIDGVSILEESCNSKITFFSGKQKHSNSLLNTKARACLIDLKSFEKFVQNHINSKEIYFLIVKNVDLAFARIMNLFYREDKVLTEDISKNASIDESAMFGKNCQIMQGSHIGKNVTIGNNVKIYPNVFIGDYVKIGDDCIIYHSATIFHAIIGNNSTIHSGARIGKDGFRYVTSEIGEHIRVPHIGRVVIGNNVEIGANSTIDRGSISDTVIGDMCKLDNLVQIGHNVVLGKGCFIVAQVGIAGSVSVGDYVAIGGQAGIADHLSIGSYSKIAAKSGLMKNLQEKEIVMGSPAQPVKQFLRQVAVMKKIINKEKI